MDMINALFSTLQGFSVLLADMGIMGPGGQPTAPVADAPAAIAPIAGEYAAAPPPAAGFMGTWGFLLLWGGVILVMYLLMFRPQRKREKKIKEMQAAITAGDYVITNAGLFGKVAGVGEDCFLIEFGTNRNIRIPVLKSEVAGIREPKLTPPPIDAPAGKDE